MGLYDDIATMYLHPERLADVPAALQSFGLNHPLANAIPGVGAATALGSVAGGISDAIKRQKAQDDAQEAAQNAKLKESIGKGQLVQHKITPNEAKAPQQAGPTNADTPHVIAQFRDESKGPTQALSTRDWAGGTTKDVKGPNIPDFSHPGVSFIKGTPDILAREKAEDFARDAMVSQAETAAHQSASQAEFSKLPIEKQLQAQKAAGLITTVPGAAIASAQELVGSEAEYIARNKPALLQLYKQAGKPAPPDEIINAQLLNNRQDAINKTLTAVKGRESF
jgi:hypothetical protein